MSRSFEFSSPIFGSSALAPHVSTRTFRDGDGYTVREETITRTRSRPAYESILTFPRTEYINQPPSTRAQSSSRGAGPGVVTSTSEYERDASGRPSHFSSTVYKSPYGKTYRFNSHY